MSDDAVLADRGPSTLAPRAWPVETVLCGMLALVSSSLAVLVVPQGGDLAAHLYRTNLVQHGVLIWDNLWFAGQYPLASYSLLYYLLAAVVGNAVLGIGGVVAASVLFASLLRREWHAVSRWPARMFAILLAGQAFTAAYPYDLGLATMLGTLWALQHRRLRVAGAATLLTLGISPLAFLFLLLALAGLFLRRLKFDRQTIAMAVAVAAAAGLQVTALALLPAPGLVYPYGAWRFAAGLAIVAVGVLLSLRGRAGWALASLFVVWAAASMVFYAVPSPVGHNIVRASVFLFPLMLVAAALADFRPRWLAITALGGALAANVAPYAPMLAVRSSSIDAQPSFWQPIIRFLHRRVGPDYRIEVVPTANHWEADFLPRAGFALARGWYRQLDMADNPTLYQSQLTPAEYRRWLRRRAVRYVVLPHLPLEAIDAQREARLLKSRSSGLKRVWGGAEATIYQLPRATPLVSGPARALLTRFNSTTIAGRVGRAGSYLLRVNYNRYWTVSPRGLCLRPAAHDLTLLTINHPTTFQLHAIEAPLEIVADSIDSDTHCRRST